MIIKSTGRLQRKMIHYARGLLVLVSIFLIFVSIWTPLHSDEIFHRWYSFPNVLLLSPLPLLSLVAVYHVWKNLNTGSEYKPFFIVSLCFLCAYTGIAISVYPYLIPYQVTLWEAAAPDSTLRWCCHYASYPPFIYTLRLSSVSRKNFRKLSLKIPKYVCLSEF